MKFTPMTDREARAARSYTFEPGTYDCLVIDAEAKVSRKGNPMVELQLEVALPNGQRPKVRDWLMLEGQMAWRLREFMHAAGMASAYDAGEVEDHRLIGLPVRAEIGIQEGDGDFLDRNRVDRYLMPESDAVHQPKARPDVSKPVERDPEDIPEDDIPF